MHLEGRAERNSAMKTFIAILLTLAIAVPATWYVTKHLPIEAMSSAKDNGRKLLYYQSAMHPWVKSDKPGRCTICGMELTPVYEGDPGFDSAAGSDVLTLTQSMIQVMNVQTTEARVLPLVKTLSVAGKLDDNASRHRVLSAYIPGRIEKLHVNFMGAEVTAGQPLAEFYSPSLLQSEREYRMLNGELRDKTALRLRQMGLTPEQIGALPSKDPNGLTSQILAPMGGTVVAKDVYEGQYVQEGQKLFEIADFSTMWFVFRAYEQDLPWIKPELKVDVTTPSHPGRTFSGNITFIDPNINDATRSADVRVELENPLVDGRRLLLHRLYADGAVHLEPTSVLTVPRSAVIEAGPEAVVFADLGAGAYERRVLKLGRRGDKLVEVISGVKEGDKVVTNGNLLMDGQAEMNRSFAAPGPSGEAAATPLAALGETEKEGLRYFLKVADDMSAALAKDDLGAFTKASEPTMKSVAALADAMKGRTELSEKFKALTEAGHFHPFSTLQDARTAFHKFTVAGTAVVEPLRKTPGAPDFQVWECFMVDQIIPDVPKKARWVQLGNRGPENPFFGKDMQDCGIAIKP